MSETTVTTKPVWFYDNVDRFYYEGNLFPSSEKDYLVIRYNGDLWAISRSHMKLTETGIKLGYGGSEIKYDSETRKWNHQGNISENYLPDSAFVNGELPYDRITILAQNLDRNLQSYYTTEQFRSGNINAPTGSIVDSIYTHSVLGGVTGVLPLLLAVMVIYVSIRKGLSFLMNLLKGV